MHEYRTHNCGALRIDDVNRIARISGWVHRKRDHGNLLFIDLRDQFGVTQCVVDTSSAVFSVIDEIRLESVLCITGMVLRRTDDTINNNIPTGEIEIKIDTVDILSSSEVLPIQIYGSSDFNN